MTITTDRLILRPLTLDDAEASRAMIEYIRSCHGNIRLRSKCAAENKASAHVIEKCGLVFREYGEYTSYDEKKTFKAKIYESR